MPAPERKSFLLRIPPDVWQDIETWAEAELRSVNGQIKYILRQAISKRRKEKQGPKDDRPSRNEDTPG